MTAASDRRGFFRDLARGAAKAAQELAGAVKDEEPALGGSHLAPPGARRTAAALPAARLASLDELRALAAEVGLGARANEAAALARPSIRLTPGGVGASRLGGVAELPPWLPWPTWEGEELAFLGQLRLDDLPASDMPDHGLLLLFFALGASPDGLHPGHAGACQAVLAGEGPTAALHHADALRELPVVASLELTLPPEPPGDDVEPFELAAWTLLRERLAEAQGVELEETAGADHAVHRLLGHPDALTGDMDLDAQLVASGVDLSSPEGHSHPRVLELEPGARDWRLLLQLSADDDLGLSFPAGDRLYVWIRDDDLRAGRFDALHAFVR